MIPMTVSYSSQIPADHRQLSSARSEIGSWLETHAEPGVRTSTLAGDIEMVVSELGANVIDHTSSPWLRIEVQLEARRAVVTITNPSDAGALPPVEVWGTLEEGHRGRGLRIIRALCDTIVVTGGEELTHIRCELPLSG